MIEFLDGLAAQFYDLPLVSVVVQGNSVLRIASERYGFLLLVLFVVLVFLLGVLLLSFLRKRGRKKPDIAEGVVSKERVPFLRSGVLKRFSFGVSKGGSSDKAIMERLSGLPPSVLPLYPVADKRQSLDEIAAAMPPAGEAPHAETEPLPAEVAPLVDDAELVESLNEVMDEIADEESDEGIDSNLEEAIVSESESDEIFDLPSPPDEEEDDETSDETIDEASSDEVRDDSMESVEGQRIAPVPALDFDPIEPPPHEERPSSEDDDDSFDIPAGTFGSDGGRTLSREETLSGEAQRKLAELSDRGLI